MDVGIRGALEVRDLHDKSALGCVFIAQESWRSNIMISTNQSTVSRWSGPMRGLHSGIQHNPLPPTHSTYSCIKQLRSHWKWSLIPSRTFLDHHTRFEISSAHLNNLICYIIYGNVVKKNESQDKISTSLFWYLVLSTTLHGNSWINVTTFKL